MAAPTMTILTQQIMGSLAKAPATYTLSLPKPPTRVVFPKKTTFLAALPRKLSCSKEKDPVLEKPEREENVFVDKEKVREAGLLQKWAKSDKRKSGDISKAEKELLAYAVEVVGKGLNVEVDSQDEENMNKTPPSKYLASTPSALPVVVWWVFAIVNPNWSSPSVGIVGAVVAGTIASHVVHMTANPGRAYTNVKKFVAYWRFN